MVRIVAPLVLLAALLIASPAAADNGQSFIRQFLIMWLPLILIIAVWIYFIRQMRAGKQAKMIERQIAMIDRYIPHMDALEQKLDRIIDLLDRPSQK